VLTPSLLYISPEDSVGKAAKLMKAKGISQLPVFDGRLSVGSISEETILEHLSKGMPLEALHSKKVQDLMEDPFPLLDPSTPISLIGALLQHNKAILIGKKGKILGIITKADLLKVV